jgi:hypothetical protein
MIKELKVGYSNRPELMNSRTMMKNTWDFWNGSSVCICVNMRF